MATSLSPYGRLDRDSPPPFESPIQSWFVAPQKLPHLKAVTTREFALENVPRTDQPERLVDKRDFVDDPEVNELESVLESSRVVTTPQPGGV